MSKRSYNILVADFLDFAQVIAENTYAACKGGRDSNKKIRTKGDGYRSPRGEAE